MAVPALKSAMFIIGLGTAAPTQRYAQRESWEALRNWPRFSELKPRSHAILKKVLCGDNGIDTRHLALEPLAEVFNQTPDALQARFERHAPALATEAARRALQEAGCAPEEMDAILISTCTGYLCPGLTSYVCEQLGLRPDIFALDLVGQGCGAALPNLRNSEAILTAGRAKKILSICFEVCSAAFFIDDDPGVLISACLFGDGAGAAVLASEPRPNRRRVQWKFAASRLVTAEREMLRFSHKNGMLRNILLPQVPQVALAAAQPNYAPATSTPPTISPVGFTRLWALMPNAAGVALDCIGVINNAGKYTNAANTPGTLLAAMEWPRPVIHKRIPRLPGLPTTASPTSCDICG